MGKTSELPANNDRADVVGFPPIVGLVMILTSIGLHLAFPANISSNGLLMFVIGVPVLAFGIGLQVASVKSLRKAKTTPLFKKPTRLILQQGLYGRSRNPIYIAVMTQVLGLALVVNTLWLIALLPVLFLYLNFLVIAREELYLEHKFGDEYLRYKSKVPRWI